MEKINISFQWWLVLVRSFHGHLLTSCFFVVVIYRLASETCLFLPIFFLVSFSCVVKWQKPKNKVCFPDNGLLLEAVQFSLSCTSPWTDVLEEQRPGESLLRKWSVFCWLQWASLSLKKCCRLWMHFFLDSLQKPAHAVAVNASDMDTATCV